MKLRKKLLSLLLCTAMLLCSCAESSSKADTASSSSQAQTEQTTTTTQQTSEQTTTATTSQTTSSTAAQTPAQNAVQGIPMWEGTDPSGNKVTFIGSMHAAKQDLYPLPDRIMNAYNSAQAVVFECDTDAVETDDGMLQVYQQMIYQDSTKLKDKLSPKAYEIFNKHITAMGTPADLYGNFKPWAAYELINSLWLIDGDISVSNGLDYYLLHKTKADKKELIELESAQMQIDILSGQSDATYEALIKSTAEYTKQSEQEKLKKLYDIWLRGDLDAMFTMEKGASAEEYKRLGLTDEEVSLIAAYNKTLNADRNIGMAEKLKGIFHNGKKTLVVIGSAHFLGDNGVIGLLEKQGYTFKRI